MFERIQNAEIVIVRIQFPGTGYVGSTEFKALSGKATINGVDDATPVKGNDQDIASVVGFLKLVPFTKGTVLKIQVNNLNYLGSDYKNMLLYVHLLTSQQEKIVERRLPLPFHSDSLLASNSDKTIVTLRFASATGYQKSGTSFFLAYKRLVCTIKKRTNSLAK